MPPASYCPRPAYLHSERSTPSHLRFGAPPGSRPIRWAQVPRLLQSAVPLFATALLTLHWTCLSLTSCILSMLVSKEISISSSTREAFEDAAGLHGVLGPLSRDCQRQHNVFIE